MKIVIEHNRVKREIVGDGFNICASRADFQRRVDVLTQELERPDWVYGWIKVRDVAPDTHSADNTSPLPWK